MDVKQTIIIIKKNSFAHLMTHTIDVLIKKKKRRKKRERMNCRNSVQCLFSFCSLNNINRTSNMSTNCRIELFRKKKLMAAEPEMVSFYIHIFFAIIIISYV